MTSFARHLAAIVAAFCLAAPVQASLVIDATFTAGFTGRLAPGSFSGTDGDMNGILEFGELTDFLWSGTDVNDIDASLSQLLSFGDYDYTANIWSQAPVPGFGSEAFFSWSISGQATVTNAIGDISRASLGEIGSVATPVPVPIPLALLGAGLVGLGLARKARESSA